MKIEIAENLVCSYLKHVEGCRIVQTNWKTSNQWKTTEYEKKQSKELFNKISITPNFQNIFKKNSFEQLIKQAEIDIIGINSAEKSVFGIDIAFHTAGLNYGSTEETTLRILKKIFRSIFIMQTYFSDYDKFNSFFVSPKVNPPILNNIRELINEANNIIGDEMILIDFIVNDSFYSRIFDQAILNISDDNDTSELFLRSIKLMQLDKRHKDIGLSGTITHEDIHRKKLQAEKKEVDGMKIGQYVQYNMRKVYEQNLVSQEEKLNLQDKSYSKENFDQSLEILRSDDKDITSSDGRNRYYAKEKFFDNYYLNSQWTERHWEPFRKWLTRINNAL